MDEGDDGADDGKAVAGDERDDECVDETSHVAIVDDEQVDAEGKENASNHEPGGLEKEDTKHERREDHRKGADEALSPASCCHYFPGKACPLLDCRPQIRGC